WLFNDSVYPGGELIGTHAVEVERDNARDAAVRDAVHHLLLEIAVGELAGPVDHLLVQLELLAELLLREIALDDAVHAPHLVRVHGADLSRQPGDGGDDEGIVGIDVEEMAHVAVRVADAVLGPQPGRLAQRDVQRFLELGEVLVLRRAREARQRWVNRVHATPSISCTATCSPALTAPRSCSSTMKQFASAIERSTPEPCCPVIRAFHTLLSLNSTPR